MRLAAIVGVLLVGSSDAQTCDYYPLNTCRQNILGTKIFLDGVVADSITSLDGGTPSVFGYAKQTTSDLVYYVSPSGSDSAACSAAHPCKSFQHVLDIAPHLLFNGTITINAAAGNYDGFVAAGFVQGFTGGQNPPLDSLTITAPVVTATLTSGSASGTATSGTAGNGLTVFGVLNKTAAGWTAHDLAGKFVRITAGTGADGIDYPILDNTTASLTIAGDFLDGIDSTSHYLVEAAGAVITTAPGMSFAGEGCAVLSLQAGVSMAVTGLAFSCAVSTPYTDVQIYGNGQVDFINSQFLDSSTQTANVSIGAGSNGVAGFFNCTSVGSNVSKHWQHFDSTSGGAAGFFEASFVSMYGGTNGIQKINGVLENMGPIGVTNISGMGLGIGGSATSLAINGLSVTCNNITTGIGLGVGSMADGQLNDDAAYFGQTNVAGVAMTTSLCNQATATMGPAALELFALTGSAHQAFYLDHSARVLVHDAGFTLDAGTEVYLDDGLISGALRPGDGGCIWNPGTGTGICYE